MARREYIQDKKTGQMRGQRGGPGETAPQANSAPPALPGKKTPVNGYGDSESRIAAAAARYEQILREWRPEDGPKPKPMARYEGLDVYDSQTPGWSVPEHREALNEAGVRLVAIDVETTSLDVREKGVTEIGWYDINDAVGGKFIPPHSIEGADEKSLEISRYRERIKGREPSPEQVAELHRILGGDGSRVNIVGSNPEFDRKHLNQLFAEHGLPPDPWGRRPLDVGAMFYWLSQRPIGSKQGLAAAAEEFDIDNSGHHDAYSDAKVAAQVWHAMESRRAKMVEAPF